MRVSARLRIGSALVAPLLLLSTGFIEVQSDELLTARFARRPVAEIEAGIFSFGPGRTAPVHHHIAPVVGYIIRGSILYQIEGEAPRLLKAGDAFFEPPGRQILRFDNASASDGGMFVDFNLLRNGEPFIVRDEDAAQPSDRRGPITRADRRSVPVAGDLGMHVDRVDVSAHAIAPGSALELPSGHPLLVLVRAGSIEVEETHKAKRRAPELDALYLEARKDTAHIHNIDMASTAHIVTFSLLDTAAQRSEALE